MMFITQPEGGIVIQLRRTVTEQAIPWMGLLNGFFFINLFEIIFLQGRGQTQAEARWKTITRKIPSCQSTGHSHPTPRHPFHEIKLYLLRPSRRHGRPQLEEGWTNYRGGRANPPASDRRNSSLLRQASGGRERVDLAWKTSRCFRRRRIKMKFIFEAMLSRCEIAG